MKADSDRWVEVEKSRFDHEVEGLEHVRSHLPDTGPYRAWSNFEFVATDGTPYEVDLLVLGPGGFHLVELKAWSGPIRGDERDWVEHNPGAYRPIRRRNPLILTRTKAQSFRSWLELQSRRAKAKVEVPWVQESLFLHGQAVDARGIPERVRERVFGREDATGNGLRRLVVDQLASTGRRRSPVGRAQEEALVGLLAGAGLRRPRNEIRVGEHVLLPGAVRTGWGWRDDLARHDAFDDEVVRVRRWFVPSGSDDGASALVRSAAEREYRLLRGLDHPGLVKARQFHQVDGAVAALVYDHHPDALELDEWLAGPAQAASLD